MNFKQLLGRKFSDPVTSLYKKFVPCEIVHLPADYIGLKVEHLGESMILSPGKLMQLSNYD